jgi:integrase
LAHIRATIKQHKRTPLSLGPKLPSQGKIESVLGYVETYTQTSGVSQREQLRRLRDRAFIFVLADTGLRISEACRLTRGHIDWAEGRAIITIKGGRESVVRFSGRALAAIKAYLGARAELDGAMGRALASLPVYARHDDGAGSKVLRLNTVGAREIVDRAVAGALGAEAKGSITPHSFRHYFVTVVLRSSGGNLKLAQELARHKNIAITQRYAHLSDEELDQNYHEICNRGKKKE